MRILYRFLASCFFVSYIPSALMKGKKLTGAGFLGTLITVPFVFVMPKTAWLYALITTAVFLAGVFVSVKAEFENSDDSRIVIDEAAGFLIAMFLLPRTWPVILSAFVLFRIFDSVKPFYISRLDKIKNAWGVMLDDAACGVLTCVLMQIFLHIRG